MPIPEHANKETEMLQVIQQLCDIPTAHWTFELHLASHPRIDVFWGSKIEGVYGRALEKYACAFLPNKPSCLSCPLNQSCEYASAYEAQVHAGIWERGTPPRHIRFQPVAWGARHVSFNVTLFGEQGLKMSDIQPVIAEHLKGLHFNVPEAIITDVRCFPLEVETTPVTWADLEAHHEWRAELITPTGLGQATNDPGTELIRAAVRRLTMLQRAWGTPVTVSPTELLELAYGVRSSHWSLQNVSTPRNHGVVIKGFTGTITLETELSARSLACLQMLRACETLGLGSANHFGAGSIELKPLHR